MVFPSSFTWVRRARKLAALGLLPFPKRALLHQAVQGRREASGSQGDGTRLERGLAASKVCLHMQEILAQKDLVLDGGHNVPHSPILAGKWSQALLVQPAHEPQSKR